LRQKQTKKREKGDERTGKQMNKRCLNPFSATDINKLRIVDCCHPLTAPVRLNKDQNYLDSHAFSPHANSVEKSLIVCS